ncbi:unnamed protein product [Effrenium voratum]|uniref:Uncharacterized protein n=1 Tax=Effrenium voratum TaxID=2562239 RepID=A0AA36IHI4_9DINO|nr:unnamed protein product [Effrenium voratum]
MVSICLLHTPSGQQVLLDPPVTGEHAVSIICGDRSISGNCAVADAIQASEAEDVTVLILAPSVYRDQILEAHGRLGFTALGAARFPASQGLDINMMPFIMGKKGSLPKSLQHYWPLIEACRLPKEELDKVGYLTVQESDVTGGYAQRREGIHLETPGVILSEGCVLHTCVRWGAGLPGFKPGKLPKPPKMRTIEKFLRDAPEEGAEEEGFEDEDWDSDDGSTSPSYVNQRLYGGIYTASTVPQSTRFWNMRFAAPADVCGPLGELTHLKEVLGPATLSEANTLYWMTDATPHESLPLVEPTHRQYFRLVTSSVSVWYAKHSTANPTGVQPDPAVTRIIHSDKFEELKQARVGPPDEIWNVRDMGLGECGESEEISRRFDI